MIRHVAYCTNTSSSSIHHHETKPPNNHRTLNPGHLQTPTMKSYQALHDIPIQVTSANTSSERRITPTWTISQLKSKLESVTGIPPSSQRLELSGWRSGVSGTDGGRGTGDEQGGLLIQGDDEGRTTLEGWLLGGAGGGREIYVSKLM